MNKKKKKNTLGEQKKKPTEGDHNSRSSQPSSPTTLSSPPVAARLAFFPGASSLLSLSLFTRFFPKKTMYRWHSQGNTNIFDAFKCVLKDRYMDRMKHIRIKSEDMTINEGKPVPPSHSTYFEGCITTAKAHKWRKNSKIAQQNCKAANANGFTARHIAGSIGFDEHCKHLEAYLQGLVKKYGEDPSNHKDDTGVWEETQIKRKGKKKGDIYGIGASYIHFLVSGSPSSESTQSDSTQQEVDRLHAQVSTMEQQQQQMKEQMEMYMRMMNMSGNQPRAPPNNPHEDN
ncbi:unnamed protein product [Lactuca saligna]|uniref:Uncharacterized protein n=1 Tax=Lactuca saligna TaxID=75948 RepID=A0AA35YKP5_LACSI|nr:unnamed protein product [Lactuca saligna]